MRIKTWNIKDGDMIEVYSRRNKIPRVMVKIKGKPYDNPYNTNHLLVKLEKKGWAKYNEKTNEWESDWICE